METELTPSGNIPRAPDLPEDPPPVGVIGGIGPMATAYFLQRIVEMTDAARDQDHVNLLISNHATTPDRTDFLLGRPGAADPRPVLARDAALLERAGAAFLVMPCNTSHSFAEQILATAGIPLVSIIDVTVAAARARVADLARVGLMATAGTVASGVYPTAFAAHGIDVVVPDAADQDIVNTVIYGQVKAGLPSDERAIRAVGRHLAQAGAAVVILGCTELSVAAVDHHLLADPFFIDAMDQLARATITRSGRRLRPGV